MVTAELLAAEERLLPTGDLEALNEGLGEILTLTAGNMAPEQVERWLMVAVKTLAREPAEALADAIEEAARTCRFSNEIVPFIIARCEEFKRPARRHLEILRSIAAAGGYARR